MYSREAGDAFPELKESWWAWPDPPAYSWVYRVKDGTPDERAVAILRIFPRTIILREDGAIYEEKALGIGGVFVPPDLRHLRFGTDLVRWVIDENSRSWTFVLFSRKRTLYKNLGFEDLNGLWIRHRVGASSAAEFVALKPEGRF